MERGEKGGGKGRGGEIVKFVQGMRDVLLPLTLLRVHLQRNAHLSSLPLVS
jgi:hypothetical protein